ncbi:MAG: methionyl-tRNA formyltransferase [Bacteroidetes bacterium]|nr:methionyl-tRNA formyltransferase [Bacteroidota bacterium]
MNIIFYGTPEFAIPSLDILVKNGFHIAAVVTVPDKPAGRGQKIITSPVKDYAVENGIKVLQPVNLKDEHFIRELRSIHADLQVVVAFRMMPEVVWNMPKHGTFNLHASLLPQYRGAAPINWAIINGEKETGVTTFFLQHEIDTGRIILHEKVAIEETETAGELHDRLMKTGAALVLKTVKAISKKNYKLTEQENVAVEGELKPAPKLNKTNTKIDLHKSTTEVANLVRGLCPYPAAFTEIYNDNGFSLVAKIFKVHTEIARHENKPGIIESDNKSYLKFFVKDGCVFIDELQVAGRNRMNIKDFLNGFKFTGNWIIQ